MTETKSNTGPGGLILSDEESKALQEVAKTASKYEQAARELGAFVGSVIGHPLRQAGGLLGDSLGILRLEMALRYKGRVDRIMHERGLSGPQREIPLSVAYPLLEAASIEEDEQLQEMFAQLLVNAIDGNVGGYIPKSFVETIRKMSPLEALILNRMVDAPPTSVGDGGMMYTGRLPDDYLDSPAAIDGGEPEPRADVALALSSLIAAGCVGAMLRMNGSYDIAEARVTEFGQALVRACRSPA
ncbi:Abi-alpha family protein [Aminobacter sp. AP02]|uniref:Abi-alpha family protein n=1 Tax=Aminobacter sp. AP02 TaxID=2135737 RepID=UPI000D6C8A2D|nr:Abi-alpha family protein [Aminobacter sp. AP02]PWK65897.1 uncharacterized protein DUF4393 [Aminobacter sp. AP02]